MKKEGLRIGYEPFEADANEYASNVRKQLAQFGTVEKIPGIKDILKRRLWWRFDLFVVNWTDNTFITPHGSLRWGVALKESLRLLGYRLAAKKILFVRHNVYPHGTAPSDRGIVKRVVDFYERRFSLSWVHSGHLANGRRHYVPHPLYQVASGDDPLWHELKLPEKYFIVFGRILPYKKIEDLLAVLPSDINLVIAGSCPEPAYLDKFKPYLSGNVTLLPRFISDPLARKLLRGSLASVLCNADDDMIISGSMVFSMSLGVPVIAMETPFAAWFRSHVNPRMITVARGLPELVEEMRAHSTRIDDDDIRAAQAHFSAKAVHNQMLISLQKMGLL